MKDLLLFDVDGTLAESTLKIKDNMIKLLKKLKNNGFKLAIVGGGTFEHISYQINTSNLHLFDYIFSENGLIVHQNIDKKLINIHSNNLRLVTEEKTLQRIIDNVLQFIINTELPYKRGSFIKFRNGMMYCTPIGSDCSYQERLDFMEYDKKHNIRIKLIKYLQENLSDINYDFKLGGNIGVGVHPKGWDKTYCLQFIDDKYNNIYFFGDRTTPDGNDYPLYNHNRIVGFGVKNPEDTMIKLNSLFIQQRDNFENLIKRVTTEKIDIEWNKVIPLEESMMTHYNKLSNDNDNYWNNLAIVKLNGGLGTSMKCNGPKSILPIKDGYSFLEVIILQIKKLNEKYNCDIPLILMNSYNTCNNKEMLEIISKYENIVTIYMFNQSKIPRINQETMKPLTDKDDDSNWKYCPPGTGDFMKQFIFSDIYKTLLKNNKTHLFLSNVDNLGAIPDSKILNYMVKNPKIDMMLEVTDKTLKDVKGGTIIMYPKDNINRLRTLEVAMVPDEHKEEFYSIELFKIFNTNNYWFNMNSIPIDYNLGLLLNPKTVNDNDVYQIEIILPDVISHFDNVEILNVPRNRFVPVKKPNDYDEIISDKYYLDKNMIIKKRI